MIGTPETQAAAIKAVDFYESMREAGWPPYDDTGFQLAASMEARLNIAMDALRVIEIRCDFQEAQEIASEALDKIRTLQPPEA